MNIPLGTKTSETVEAVEKDGKFVVTQQIVKEYDAADYLIYVEQQKNALNAFENGIKANEEQLKEIKVFQGNLDKLKVKAEKLRKAEVEDMKKEREQAVKDEATD